MPANTKVLNARSASRSRLGFAPRRNGAFTRPAEELGQPQDGAVSADVDGSPFVSGSREPEDAGLTGGTRSLMRRVLGLNVTQPASKPVRSVKPAMPRTSVLKTVPAV